MGDRPGVRAVREDDHEVARADHAEVLAGAALEGAGVVPQALDARFELLDAGLGLADAAFEEALAAARGVEVARALDARDAEQGEEEHHRRPEHGAERIGAAGRLRPVQEDQRGKAAAPG